jgi:ribosome-associated toxin RatA of RatAB toxin-antitoxin module
MRTVDRALIRGTADAVFARAADVERWPEILPHYRWVRMLERRPGGGVVEMSANRPFGPLDWPTWWVSEMWIEPERRVVRYKHVRGVTTGMDVEWVVRETAHGTEATIVHEWSGPPWPLIRRPAAEWVIGPVFVHGIASRTLAGIKQAVEETA